MKKKCPNCHLVNFQYSLECARCEAELVEIITIRKEKTTKVPLKIMILKRFATLVLVSIAAVFGFYLSLIMTSDSLSYEQEETVNKAIEILDEKGFSEEVFLLRYVASFRSNDNWLNASTKFESAYAATNYPFEIMTIYPDFFDQTMDDTERAAILLHEAKHLQGEEEKEAYEFVWTNKKQLGWTIDTYSNSPVWNDVRRQTKMNVPTIFVCNFNDYGDCSE